MEKKFTRKDYETLGCPADLVIPDSYTEIDPQTFRVFGKGDNNIKSIVFSSYITDIPEGLCRDCANLTSVTLSPGIETIGSDAFSGTALDRVVVDDTVTVLEPDFDIYTWLACYDLDQRGGDIYFPEDIEKWDEE